MTLQINDFIMQIMNFIPVIGFILIFLGLIVAGKYNKKRLGQFVLSMGFIIMMSSIYLVTTSPSGIIQTW